MLEGGIGVDYPVAARSFFFFSPVHFYLPSLSPSASLLQFMRHQLRKQSLQIQTAAPATSLFYSSFKLNFNLLLHSKSDDTFLSKANLNFLVFSKGRKKLKYTIGAKALKGSKTGTKSSKKRRAQPTVKCVLQAIDNWLEKKSFLKPGLLSSKITEQFRS